MSVLDGAPTVWVESLVGTLAQVERVTLLDLAVGGVSARGITSTGRGSLARRRLYRRGSARACAPSPCARTRLRAREASNGGPQLERRCSWWSTASRRTSGP